ncbi:MAG: hypothetical protein AB1489_25705 [Acidobacteriota bacterium]
MLSQNSLRSLLILAIMMALVVPSYTLAGKTAKAKRLPAIPADKAIIWQPPADISTLDLYYGEGGKEHEPKGKMKFIKEDRTGSQTKFIVQDQEGVRWKIKVGPEAQSETVATRLLWAVGYFTDLTYYKPQVQIEGMAKYQRRRPMPGGAVIRGALQKARLERLVSDEDKVGEWSWFENPFLNTREFNGLKVMMALINNWDLKELNNKIYYDDKTDLYHYLVSDLGASFGRTGGKYTRSKNNLKHYVEAPFIKKVAAYDVDFVLNSRPPFLFWIKRSYWRERTRMSKIVKDIPRDDAHWIGQLLAQLSDEQLQDAFRAAGYQPQEVNMFANALRARINALAQL